jgi:predicted ATP-binding protein involved in virulence
MEYFITEIDIKKVRHLENLTIKLSDTERKHLILTGKNGSGKTSVLECMRDYLKSIESDKIKNLNGLDKANKDMENGILLFSKDNSKSDAIVGYKTAISHYKSILNQYKFYEIEAKINNEVVVSDTYQSGDFVLVYFPATKNRTEKPNSPKSSIKLDFPEIPKFENKLNEDFIQYLVNLQTRGLYAEKKKDTETVTQIDTWFANFTKILQSIFQDNTLQLDFDIDNMNFNILTKGREKFDFTTLSDGYSAFLNIVTEIILRMESKAPKVYDIQGIVLIDEIETHLHIDLQKKIMPLLTTFFPKIQFIVTTHSPFVLSSISNAVIYDLEKHLRVEDLSSYAVDGIIEGYFDADKYSQEIKTKMARYEILAQKEQKTIEEREELVDLRSELKDISAKLAPELAYAFKTLELSRLSKING